MRANAEGKLCSVRAEGERSGRMLRANSVLQELRANAVLQELRANVEGEC